MKNISWGSGKIDSACVLIVFGMAVILGFILMAIVTAMSTDEATPAVESAKEAHYIEMEVTAYCICEKCCGKRPDDPLYGITASGVGVRDFYGLLVAAPPEYPFGTKFTVDGVVYVCQDRGGAIVGNKLDILMESHEKALEWGRKTLMVKVERP